MKNRFFLLLVILFLLIAKESTAQTQKLKFNLVSGTNGISLGKITGITRDPHGVMWFTDQTNNCIIRYDGNQMTRYRNDPKNPNSPGGTYPEFVYADSSGIIWIGFYGMGLDRMDPKTNQFTHYRHQPKLAGSLSNDTVTSILIDHLGILWVGTYGGLDRLDQKAGTFKNYRYNAHDTTSLSHNKIRALYEDKAGTLWIGTGLVWDNNKEGGLNRFNRETGTFTRYLNDPKNPHSLINNKVRAIFEDSRGTFWVGTLGDGLHTMDRKTGLFERHIYNPANPEKLSRPALKTVDDHITFIIEDEARNIWIGTFANGLNRYDPIAKKITHFGNNADKSGAFKDNSGWWANASADGLFWISTQETNLYKVDLYTNNIPHYNVDNTGINSYHQESETVMWFGTEKGLIRKDLKKGTITRYVNDPINPNSISNNIVGTIYKDKEGYLWLATRGGLNRMDPNTKNFSKIPLNSNNTNLGSNEISIILEDDDLNMWVGTFGDGLTQMNRKTGTTTQYKNIPSDSNTISNDVVTSFVEDETKDIWIGTYNNGGVNRMNRHTGKFKHYLQGISITSMYRDAGGVIWAAAENGLYSYNREVDEFFSMDEKNVDLNIYKVRSVIGDDQDNLWISSANGIYRLNKSRDQIIFYGKENGVVTEFMYYGSGYKGLDGKLFFGDNNGYFAFYPEQLKISPVEPKINFSNFWLKGQVVQPAENGPLQEPIFNTKEIRLKYDQNVFSFSFAAIDYGNPGDKKIYYKLENYDKDWRQSTTEDKAYYFNVAPGKYSFRIKAANTANGVWVEKNIDVIISPPWWSTWWAYFVYILLFAVLVYSFHRFQKKRLIKAERERTRERELAQAKEIEKAYRELSTTQSQLIQSEKMASLGKLTAGIAHEIQNPLNFVNNFSEVNSELIDEMQQELKAGNSEEAITISNSIKENQEKINHHGKRADAIVKGMLQHSRSSSGVKEPTDINVLADEYLRLAYHGLRARDKSFNATMKTDFDDSIGTINIIPQDIGRVILNLINNAFYAVADRKKSGIDGYEPTVSISTKKINARPDDPVERGKVEIKVKDNGNGIPSKALDKIFQPFFTTKPTGQGTGLGLSLGYDIIKAHGGEIKVQTKEGEGAEFIIQFPTG